MTREQLEELQEEAKRAAVGPESVLSRLVGHVIELEDRLDKIRKDAALGKRAYNRGRPIG